MKQIIISNNITKCVIRIFVCLCISSFVRAGVSQLAQVYLSKAHQAYEEGKIPLAVEALDQGLQAYKDKNPGYYKDKNGYFDMWSYWMWEDAQKGRGKNDNRWGAFVYEWIENTATRDNRIDWQCHVRANLIGDLASLGYQARCKSLIYDHEAVMSKIGFSHNTQNFLKTVLWFPALPDVWNRQFPLKIPSARHVVYWQRKEADRTPDKPIILDNIQVAMMSIMADNDWDSGAWQNSIEKRLWIIKWAEEVNRQNEDESIKQKLDREHANSMINSMDDLATKMEFLGFNEKALSLIDQAIATPWVSQYHEVPKMEAIATRAEILANIGTPDADSVETLRSILRNNGNNEHFDLYTQCDIRIKLHQVLTKLARYDEADELLKETIAMAATSGKENTLQILDIERLMRLKSFDGLEARLADLLNKTRLKESKLGELRLLNLYAEYSIATGNLAQALMVKEEVLRIIRSCNLYPLEAKCLAEIAMIKQLSGNNSGAAYSLKEAQAKLDAVSLEPRTKNQITSILDKVKQNINVAPVITEKKQSSITIQPRSATSISLEGHSAKAIFTLANPYNRSVSGTVRFSNQPVHISWDEESAQAQIEITPEAKTNPEQEVTLGAGEIATFETILPPNHPSSGDLQLEWTEKNGAKNSSTWKFEPSEKDTDYAVIDAGLYEHNPFHLVPVFHHLQMKKTDAASIRVLSSEPARIELYDASDKLALVDAQGNGSLLDPGDQLGWDEDRNGWPEIKSTNGEAIVHLYVHPAKKISKDGLKLKIQWLINGEWQLLAEDHIVSSSAEK